MIPNTIIIHDHYPNDLTQFHCQNIHKQTGKFRIMQYSMRIMKQILLIHFSFFCDNSEYCLAFKYVERWNMDPVIALSFSGIEASIHCLGLWYSQGHQRNISAICHLFLAGTDDFRQKNQRRNSKWFDLAAPFIVNDLSKPWKCKQDHKCTPYRQELCKTSK